MSKQTSSLLLAESDDDEDLGMAPTFRRSRTETKKREGSMAFLDAAVEEVGERRKTLARIDQIKKEELDEDELQKRAEEMANENRGSAREQQMRAHNEINGITDANNDDQFDQARRTELANLATTNQATLMGTRMILTRVESIGLFQSIDQAIEALLGVAEKLERRKSDNGAIILAKNLRMAMSCGMLGEMLQSQQIVNICELNRIVNIPGELEEWLWKVACSADQRHLVGCHTSICAGACETAQALWKSGMASNECMFMDLRKLVPLLKEFFGLQIDFKPSSRGSNETVGASVGPSSDQVVGSVIPNHLTGLKHFLFLWKMALASAMMNPESMSSETVADCVVGLTCTGLDRSIYEGHGGIVKALKQTLVGLLASPPLVAMHESTLLEWMKTTSHRILGICQGLGPGDPSAEDKDDMSGWLCRSQAVRMFTRIGCDREVMQRSQFLLCIGPTALQMCLRIEKWEQYVESELMKRGLIFEHYQELPWNALASAYVGLRFVRTNTEQLEEDSHRFLAIVELVRYCTLGGMDMLACSFSKIDPVDSLHPEKSSETYKSVEVARQVYAILDLIDSEWPDVVKEAAQRASIPNFRRSEFSLALLGGFIRKKKENAAGDILPKTNKVQTGIQSFFASADADSQDESTGTSP